MKKQNLIRLVGVASLTLLSACSFFHDESSHHETKPMHLSEAGAPHPDVVPGGAGFPHDTTPVEVPAEMPMAPAPEQAPAAAPVEQAPMVCPACKAHPCVCPPAAPAAPVEPAPVPAPVEPVPVPVPAPAAAAA